jgi:hypothetical protein
MRCVESLERKKEQDEGEKGDERGGEGGRQRQS